MRAHVIDDDARLTRVFRETTTVAVLGAKEGGAEPANYVPKYLQGRGYRILPVNPILAGRTLLGETVVATLADLPQPVDLIDVFRRPEYLPAHAREIIALPWHPRVVWFQLGIRHDGAAAELVRAGIDVVQDRFMMPEHRRLIRPV